MALSGVSTTSKLLRSSFLTPELYDRILSQEKVSCSEQVHMQPCSALGKGCKIAATITGPSSSSSFPPSSFIRIDSPKAGRDIAAVYEGIAGLTAQRSMQHGAVVMGKDPSFTAEEQELSALGYALTALQRSLLETQWALSANESLELNLGTLPGRLRSIERSNGEGVAKIVSSGRPSARQRRMEARKSTVSSCRKAKSKRSEAIVTAVLPVARKSRAGRRGRPPKVLGPLEQVGTYTFMKDRRMIELLTAEQEVSLAKKIRIGQNLRAVKKKLTEALGCEPTDEQWATILKMPVGELLGKLQEADRARDEMFMANVRLVVSIAKRYSHMGVELSDLIQEGGMGLLRGLEKFNHKKGFKLSTYVHWWIRQGVTRAIAEHSRTVRIPVHLHERLSLIRKAKAILHGEGAPTTVKNISEVLNLSDQKITNALKVTKRITSLDKERRPGCLQSNNETMHNYVADPNIENNPWAVVDRIHVREDVDGLLASTLSSREREIIRLHYGLDRTDGLCVSLENISHRIGLSRERVRQVETAAMRKLLVASKDMWLDAPSPY